MQLTPGNSPMSDQSLEESKRKPSPDNAMAEPIFEPLKRELAKGRGLRQFIHFYFRDLAQ